MYTIKREMHIEQDITIISDKLIKGVSFLRNCGAASVGEYNEVS